MRAACLLVCAFAAACGDDPVSLSQPVGISLKAKSDDVQSNGGSVTDEKAINTESGNPYGAFVTAARQALGGADPARIEVDKATLYLALTSTGVSALEEVFSAQVDIGFVMNDTNDSFPVARANAPTGRGPHELEVLFTPPAPGTTNFPKLLGGSFKVVLNGPAAAGFTAKGANADLQVTFTFTAFE